MAQWQNTCLIYIRPCVKSSSIADKQTSKQFLKWQPLDVVTCAYNPSTWGRISLRPSETCSEESHINACHMSHDTMVLLPPLDPATFWCCDSQQDGQQTCPLLSQHIGFASSKALLKAGAATVSGHSSACAFEDIYKWDVSPSHTDTHYTKIHQALYLKE